MGTLTDLFGGEINAFTVTIALAIVIVLIVLLVWLLKLVGDASQRVGRGRNRRLAVIDSVAIDNKRQAVIIRRDDAEHLIVIGGPNDLLVESGFSEPEQQSVQRPLRRKPLEAAPAAPAPAPVVAPERAQPVRPATTSLRHTGLLRPVDEPKLDGGKSDNGNGTTPDSATRLTTTAVEPEPKLETRDKDQKDISSKS